jgi:hypothetical protein
MPQLLAAAPARLLAAAQNALFDNLVAFLQCG